MEEEFDARNHESAWADGSGFWKIGQILVFTNGLNPAGPMGESGNRSEGREEAVGHASTRPSAFDGS